MGDDGHAQNKENDNKNMEKEIENKNKEENEDDVNPKPVGVVAVKKHADYKMGKLKSALEQQQQKQLSESDDVILDATPLNLQSPTPDIEYDLAQVVPPLQKFKKWVAEIYSKAPTPIKDDTPAPTPTRSRLKIIRPKPPEPKLALLNQSRGTYLRPRPDSKPASQNMDNPKNTYSSMGPPPEPRIFKTPYETVKDAVTFLKTELWISEADYDDMMETDDAAAAEYSLSRVTPDSLFSMDEVVMELDLFLNSLPETASSDFMKRMMLSFQTRLGLPPQPGFYNLMWTSPAHFMTHLALAQQASEEFDDDPEEECVDDPEEKYENNPKEEYDDDRDEEYENDAKEEYDDDPEEDCDDDDAGDHNSGRRSCDNRAFWVDEIGETNAFRIRYDHLPPPSLPFYDAIEILYVFVNRIQNGEDYDLDEMAAFLDLQFNLLLPEWFSLYELYRWRSMAGVVHFIHEYFGTSKMSRRTDNYKP